jgi:SnoaL-like domain
MRPKIPVEDRLEIQELFAYYAWGLNTGDEEQVLSCFTEDASFEHLPQGIFHGHEQIKILLGHLWYDKPGASTSGWAGTCPGSARTAPRPTPPPAR